VCAESPRRRHRRSHVAVPGQAVQHPLSSEEPARKPRAGLPRISSKSGRNESPAQWHIREWAKFVRSIRFVRGACFAAFLS